MAYLKNCIIALVLIAGAYAQDTSDLSCWQQRCHECSVSQSNKPTDKTDCSTNSLMGPHWIEPESLPTPTNTNNNTSNNTAKVDFICVKFIASDPTIDGDSSIALRGCALKSEADGLCNGLTALAQGKNKTTVQCISCLTDHCNGSAIVSTTAMMALLTFLVTIKTLF